MNIVDVETEIKMHGYEPLNGVMVPSEKVLDFATFIEDFDIPSKPFSLGPSTQKEVLLNTKAFFNKRFKLHKIPYKGNIRARLDTPLLKYIPGQDVPLFLYNNLVRYVHPFHLPVSFTNADMTQCMVVEHATYIVNDDFLKRMVISYRGITLPEQITELTESSYVHELTHTQLGQKGIIKNYYNSEILSIFLEILNVYESSKSEKLLGLQDAIRLTELYDALYSLEEQAKGVASIDKDTLINYSKYSESIIKAYGLFINYYYGSPALRKYILNSIQNIFDGNLCLEELLDEFELGIDQVLDDNRLIKYFTR